MSATHWWDTLSGSTYSSEAILDNECNYEVGTGLNRGLKLGSSFSKNTARGSSSCILDHTESYIYDPKLHYLTGANYGDGLPNATPSWAYDAAGNRTDTVTDNLNRPTTISGISSTSDILGNRLTLGSQSYGWDCLNRMISYGTTNSYVYRADGMRVSKVAGSTSTVYRYDDEVSFEDTDVNSGIITVTDYGLGSRGLDYIASTKSGTTSVGFPNYDAHGNMSACLFRSGTTSFTLGNQRHYDAWGVVRSGATAGDPKGRYCANLGHKQDDESGLVYMRARYYEPSSGRFLIEDGTKQGLNWFQYCSQDPVDKIDSSGKEDDWGSSWLNHLFNGAGQWFNDGLQEAFESDGLEGVSDFLQENFQAARMALGSGLTPSIMGSGMCLRLLISNLQIQAWLNDGTMLMENPDGISYLSVDADSIGALVDAAETGDVIDVGF